MPIVSKLKVVMADRDISVNELSEKVGRSAVNLSPLALQSLKRYSNLAAGGFVSRAALPTGRFTRVRAARSRGAGLTEPAGVAEASFVIFPLKRHGKDA